LILRRDDPINGATVEMATVHVSKEVRRRAWRATGKHPDDELTESGIDTDLRLGCAVRSYSPSSTEL
jgi:hypothetical protein